MKMDELTKSQIVLLTLLVSFVTSIATGIVTVSLMQQAPPAITQSVSRVIQETVQTVSPASGSQHAAASVTQEKTVVVSESDLISKAVARVSPSLVRVFVTGTDGPLFVGLGIVLDSNGTLAADSDAIGEAADATVGLADGTSVRVFVRQRDASAGIAYLAPATSTPESHWVPAVVSTQHVVLGQSVVALSGKNIPRIGSGLVVSLLDSGTASTSPQIIETSIAADSIMPGSPLIDTQGAIVGLRTGVSSGVSAADFISGSALVQPLLK